ncbi:hypothetical protein LEP1GSC060_2268 [Leptospira weilii serovar Ranarum str. ICFT]|uniref:Uncharacterized protein n=1 Tax=Leptospira weilii serovar Ranarum str. ICFT TaxID=1218598 RepID=N1WAS6_9LEPT|nr:hypothetical protein LEP1GSC060_2268 [Leptospira weilii serovar Ranarum str. ICFT]
MKHKYKTDGKRIRVVSKSRKRECSAIFRSYLCVLLFSSFAYLLQESKLPSIPEKFPS